jgi:hypothetical protein
MAACVGGGGWLKNWLGLEKPTLDGFVWGGAPLNEGAALNAEFGNEGAEKLVEG